MRGKIKTKELPSRRGDEEYADIFCWFPYTLPVGSPNSRDTQVRWLEKTKIVYFCKGKIEDDSFLWVAYWPSEKQEQEIEKREQVLMGSTLAYRGAGTKIEQTEQGK